LNFFLLFLQWFYQFLLLSQWQGFLLAYFIMQGILIIYTLKNNSFFLIIFLVKDKRMSESFRNWKLFHFVWIVSSHFVRSIWRSVIFLSITLILSQSLQVFIQTIQKIRRDNLLILIHFFDIIFCSWVVFIWWNWWDFCRLMAIVFVRWTVINFLRFCCYNNLLRVNVLFSIFRACLTWKIITSKL